MKEKHIKKIFTLIGFLLLAFVALNMNACSKDKSGAGAPNPYGPYGNWGNGQNGGSNLGQYIALSGDQKLFLDLVFSTNGQQVGAYGSLDVAAGSVGCSMPPGHYVLQTMQPGTYSNGSFYDIKLSAQANGGLEILIDGWLTDYVDINGKRHFYAYANIPGCPTAFE